MNTIYKALGRTKLILGILLMTGLVGAASLTYVGNDGKTLLNGSNGITIKGVPFNGLAGDFWFNARWSVQSPVIPSRGTGPVNLYAPAVKYIGSTLFCYSGGETGDPAYPHDTIYYSTSSGDLASWTVPEVAVTTGDYYFQINDPSVADDGSGTYVMVYTVNYLPDPTHGQEWIGLSTSTNGTSWSPAAASFSQRIVLADPNNLMGQGATNDVAPGDINFIARPSIIRRGSEYWMWFDSMRPVFFKTYLAKSSVSDPRHFTLSAEVTPNHYWEDLYPVLLESSVWEDGQGALHAVFRRSNRWEIWKADNPSNDGFTWANMTLLIDPVNDPAHFGGHAVHNPGIVYDPVNQIIRGILYGCDPGTDHTSQATVQLAYPQYKVFAHSGSITHANGYSLNKDDFLLGIGSYTTYDRIQVTNPVAQSVIIDLQGLSGVAGDIWQYSP